MADLNLASTSSLGLGLVAATALSARNVALSASDKGVGVVACGALTSRNVSLSAHDVGVGLVGATGLKASLSLLPVSTGRDVVAVAYLSAARPLLAAPILSYGRGSAALFIADELILPDVVDAVLSLFGLCCSSPAVDDCLLGVVLDAINAAMQQIYSRSKELDYFNSSTLSLTVGTSGTVALPKTVQSVLSAPRFNSNKRPLVVLDSQAKFDRYADTYCGGSAPAAPRASFLLATRGSAVDSVSLSLWVTPAPASDTVFLLDVALEPPRYARRDIAAGTTLSIPHSFVELLLLPIVRKWATAQRWFTRREQQPEIDQQYAAALAALGLVSPESPAETKARATSK